MLLINTRASRWVLACGATVAVVLTAGCSSNSPSAPSASTTLHAEAADAAGDAVASAPGSITPDLTHATVDVASGTLTLTIQFAPGTFDRATTRLTIDLDSDQNAATGVAGGGLGIDYSLDVLATRTPSTLVQQATPTTCATGGSCFVQVGTASITTGTASVTTSVPLSMIGNSSGRINYRVFAYVSPLPGATALVADLMPDITAPPAHVP